MYRYGTAAEALGIRHNKRATSTTSSEVWFGHKKKAALALTKDLDSVCSSAQNKHCKDWEFKNRRARRARACDGGLLSLRARRT